MAPLENKAFLETTERSPSPDVLPTSNRNDGFFGTVRVFLRHIGLGASVSRVKARKVQGEEPKAIVDRSLRIAIARSWIHAIPLAMTVVLSYLHISGFYIGADLEGFKGHYSDALKTLMLQTAAKVLELLLVASLTTVVVDIIRTMMIRSSIPLGMMSAHLQFPGLEYFWSPGFWGARRGFRSNRKFMLVGSFLALCGAIALFAGPAAALLLIPVYRQGWYAGGTDYWLAGNRSTLWPQRLTINDVGAGCAAPGGTRVATQLVSDSGCVWGGYSSLKQAYREAHQQHIVNVSISDGLSTRVLQRLVTFVAEPFTIAPSVAVTNPSSNFGYFWIKSLSWIKGLSSYAHYQRNPREKYFEMKSYVPLVRTLCYYYINFTSPNDYWEYPYFPTKGSAANSFRLPKQPFINSTVPTTTWLVPNSSFVLSNTSMPLVYPSAFLNMQIPAAGLFEPWGAFFTCSVDARWINSSNIGMQFDPDVPGQYFTYAKIPDSYMQNGPRIPFPFTDDFVNVTMDLDFLNTLTPPALPTLEIANSTFPNYTTLADILRTMRLDDGFTDLAGRLLEIDSAVATVVADGMSRIGYAQNGGSVTLATSQNYVVNRYSNMSDSYFAPLSDWGRAVWRGRASTPFVPGYDASNSTLMRWEAFIEGYSFKADEAAYWLSLALFYVYSAIAIAHVVWRVTTRVSSDAWEGVTDLIALAAVSKPPDRSDADERLGDMPLQNACGGVEEWDTMALSVGARVVASEHDSAKGTSSGCESVQLVFGSRAALERRGGLRKVRENVEYGAAPVGRHVGHEA